MDVSPKIIGIGGSPRKNGNSDVVLNHILRGAVQKQAAVKEVQLGDYRFGPCIGCEKCRIDEFCSGLKDDLTLLYPEIAASRGLVLVSPTHTYNVTAMVKAFIDRLYCLYDFTETRPRQWESRLAGQNRKAVIASICEQEDSRNMGVTLEAMRLPLASHGYEIIAEISVFGLFDKGAVKDQPDILTGAAESGKKLALALLTRPEAPTLTS